jgi:hypothetical protein
VSWLGLSASTLNAVVKNSEEIERSYAQCNSSFKFVKSRVLTRCRPNNLLGQKKNRKVQKIKTIFWNAVEGLQAARKYVCQFDTEDSIVICNEVANFSCFL